MNSTDFAEYLAPCCTIAREAGQLIMGYFSPSVVVQKKTDDTPVTEADTRANDYIVAKLQKLTPNIPIIAEEDKIRIEGQADLFWLVDPLDGTRAFIKGEPEFTVNIGLIQNGAPLLGVIYAPPQELLYFGDNVSAFRAEKNTAAKPITVRKPSSNGLIVVKSKSHPSAKTQAYLDTLNIRDMRPGSSSIKFCMVADGSADLYPRFGRTMEWDTAAGHAILNAAGGRVETIDGQPLTYGKPGFENPGFIAFGG